MPEDTIRQGTIDLSACESETIRNLGKIQAYGCLLVLQRPDGALAGYSTNAPPMLARDLVLGHLVDSLIGRALWNDIATVPADAVTPSHPRTVDLAITAPELDTRFQAFAHDVGEQIILEFLPRRPTPIADAEPAVASGPAPDLFRLCLRTAERVRALTGYDRVMIYRFHPDWTGEVIAELRRPDMTPYLGLRYPATDIPIQARQLFRETLIRLIVDTEESPVALELAVPSPDLGRALLRSASPYHLEYLRNMGVGGSFTLSIMINGELWGMIACHHDSARCISYECQQKALGIAQELSTCISVLEESEARLRHQVLQRALDVWRERLKGGSESKTLLWGLGSLASDLQADGVALVCGDACLTLGSTPDCDWLFEAMRILPGRADPEQILTTDQLAAVPGLLRPPAALAGAMIATLPGPPAVGLFVFRVALVREVHWGGDPGRPALVSPDDGRLTPRRSFALWRELVEDKARAWTEEERGVFAFCASWLDSVRSVDPEAFGSALREQLDDLANAYLRLGAPQRLLVDVLPAETAVMLWVAEGAALRLLHANRAFVDMFGLDLSDLLTGAPEQVLARIQFDRSALDIEIGQEQELDIWSPAKGPRRVRARREHLVRYRGPDGDRMVEGLLLSDITASSRTHEAMVAAVRHAEMAESARNALLRNMSHELRTPLNVIMGYSDFMASEMLGPLGQPAYLKAAEGILAGATHLLSLIDSTLEMARLRDGLLTLNEAPADLREILAEAVTMVQPLADVKVVTLRLKRPENPVVAVVDELAFRQIIINLINNAIKFTSKGGIVTVAMDLIVGGELRLSVTDNGIGIPAASIARLFQPFSQIDSGLSRRNGGSGLGLSIVKALVQLHGGSVDIDSTEGIGSTFTVRLPSWRMRGTL